MNILDDNQYGAIPNSSTTMALISMLHSWSLCTDGNGATVRTLLLDYRKAFDLIDHSILVRKLRNQCKLPASIINWIIDFLSDRSQRIKCQPTMAGINCRSNFIVQAYRSLLCRWILKSNSILWILSVKVRRHVSSLHLSMTRRLALLACDLRLLIKYVTIKKKAKKLDDWRKLPSTRLRLTAYATTSR